MFSRIAPRYDRMNRLMTLGQDRGWRRRTVELAALSGEGIALDVATGTGDLAVELAAHCPAVAVDFSTAMLDHARQKLAHLIETGRARLVCADALRLPFADDTFQAAVIGFALRNVVDLLAALGEIRRVLLPGGRLVCLELTPLPNDAAHAPVRFYVRHVVPLLGRLVAGDGAAYQYLPDSVRRFPDAETLRRQMLAAGFRTVDFQVLNFGSVALHCGVK
ncbi:MAG: ubiquinone/menaquinone biosynthesis methyltransferase [Chloroflexi bacterium]|nr:ubiquinone/menaquinone biosynthesis methyltransferase [Chloroflexota bacterium]